MTTAKNSSFADRQPACCGAPERESKIRAQGRQVLENEAQALLGFSRSLDANFDRAVEIIAGLKAQGRVIIVGIGKTGFIGMKISASFASIGVPSFFLHPAEAVHGDLGRLSASDVVVLLSNSGETPEVLRIVPSLRKIGVHIIAVTGAAESFLGRRSDVVIACGKFEEAGLLGLAPTTSTTVMLAVGDALVMAVLAQRPISREEFALYHPGGALGRTLMLVSEIMRSGDEHCMVPEGMLVREVLNRITSTKGRPGAASIVDAQGRLAGVFTDGDLRRLLNDKTDFLDLPVSRFMTRTPKFVRPGALAEEALKVMSEHKIDQVIVLAEDKTPVGMVDIQDLVQAQPKE